MYGISDPFGYHAKQGFSLHLGTCDSSINKHKPIGIFKVKYKVKKKMRAIHKGSLGQERWNW